MDIEKAREKLRQRRATMDMLRGRPLTAKEQVTNILEALTRCDQCDNEIEHDWNYCAWCGWKLVDDEDDGQPSSGR